MKKNTAVEVICFLLILLFVYAAVNKLMDVQKFRVQIGQSPFLSQFARFVAWFIPVSEIIVAIMLAFQRIRVVGLYASFSLMVMFTAYIVVILNFSSHVPCSCGGILEKMGWTEHLIFNIVFTLLALLGVVLSSKREITNHKEIAAA
ncbi:hypothetical protein KK083_30675 [Fulvivirgaceae bacterium PWU4]|uniref:Methylamine utilisation protein MauE domain-containing protein n=1 Tax=Chryseosolibacter histidini TaxID=2782349 RepID=A0AAP2DU62_9BACT|nr:MauE/DoxX family redox-associated membrane protein [Chryseosolibacter histidini]MBT1701297.1 hypothetical protein [Chryseosolibacter histidini]